MNRQWYVILIFLSLFVYQISAQQRIIREAKNKVYEKEGNDWYSLEKGRKFKVSKELIEVKLKTNISIEDIDFVKIGLPEIEIAKEFKLGEYHVLRIKGKRDILEISEKLSESGLFDYIKPDSYCSYSSTPNDSKYNNPGQWNLNQINMPQAWDISTGSDNVVVALIDGGADIDHQDLINNKNTSNIGWNYATDSDVINYYTWHGTACAGIISASNNNTEGVASISGGWNGNGTKLMYFNIADLLGYGQSTYIAQALRDAADWGAKVISMSLNPEDDEAITSSINYAVNTKNVVVVVSSGNYTGELDEDVQFPRI